MLSALLIAGLLTATFVITSREGSPPKPPEDASGSWSIQSRNTSGTLFDVAFVDTMRGWIVGDGGVVLHTSDGGKTWERQNSGTEVTLLRVSFVDANEGWAVGKLGVIIHTSDAGKNWERQGDEIALGRNLVGASFVDNRTGWVVTERGSAILRTEDGGETWSREFLSNPGVRSDLVFIDARRGWAVFAQGSLLHTSEGGDAWVHQPGVNGVRIGATGAFFLDESQGWISGWRGKGFQFVRFLTDGMVARTTDGGNSWTRHDSGTGRALLDVAFSDARNGWAVGASGTIVNTRDGGLTWAPWPSGTQATLRALVFPDPDNGWAVGDDGTVLNFARRSTSVLSQ